MAPYRSNSMFWYSCSLSAAEATDCALPCSPEGGYCSTNGNSTQQICVCNSGFTGTYCETPVCYSGKSCLNGGTCEIMPENQERYCSCPSGFIGPLCSDRITCTNDSQCEGNQTCQERDGEKFCSCDSDRTGFFCKMSVTPGEKKRVAWWRNGYFKDYG